MDLSLKLHYGKSYIGIFKDIAITEGEKFVEVQLSDLVAEHIGGTAKQLKSLRKQRGVSCLWTRHTARFWERGCRDANGQHE